MTEQEKKDIERDVKYLMASLAMKYEDIPREAIFQLINSTVLEFAVELLLEKKSIEAIKKAYPEGAKKIEAIFQKGEK